MAENELNMRRWEARLSETKLRNLRQIENAHHGGVVRALDALLPLSGLWQDFHLGSWNREILKYLGSLLRVWTYILDGLPVTCVTPQTVSTLQLRAPSQSHSDERLIVAAMEQTLEDTNGRAHFQLFPGIAPVHREAVIRRIRTCDRIVSFHTFFEDMVYIEVCHHSMRCLLSSRMAYRRSFESGFREIFYGSEETFRERYLQLWLYAMRHFPELSDLVASSPRKNDGSPRPVRSGLSEGRRGAFITFATDLGFKCSTGKGHRMPREILPDVPCALRPPLISTDLVDTPIRARCNRPFERSFYVDRKHLFAEHVFAAAAERLEYTTTFAMAKDLILSLWGPQVSPILHTAHLRRHLSRSSAPESTDIDHRSQPEQDTETHRVREHGNTAGTDMGETSTGTPPHAAIYPPINGDLPVEPSHSLLARNEQAVPEPAAEADMTTTLANVQPPELDKNRKRAERTTDDTSTDAPTTRAGQVAQAKMALALQPNNWCVVDEQGSCHVGHDNTTLGTILRRIVGPDRTLHVLQESQLRVTMPKAALIEARRPGAIFIITEKVTAGQSERLAERGSARRLQPWKKIQVDLPTGHGRDCTVGVEATGDRGRKLILQNRWQAEIGAVELHSVGTVEASSSEKSYHLHRYAGGRVKIEIHGLTFECDGDEWRELISSHEEEMAEWRVDETFEDL
ncbi:hypothetical protein LTR82_017932 [Friedmanniomyces endolithicus]|uniref:Uncharacterized protein n=1 Tax=Friedmanniomyces endolithicus TaxID=329885 RepID=A0AAN6F5J1_9PEZI|nr:hypothetical protein LTR82_017932 [Friedmanniomyces endolithicus]